jgi:hypothetical protein
MDSKEDAGGAQAELPDPDWADIGYSGVNQRVAS